MAKVKVAAEVLAMALFGYSEHEVEIVDGVYDPSSFTFEFEIRGSDVPNCESVTAIYHERRNNMGQKFTTMEFKDNDQGPAASDILDTPDSLGG